MCIPPASFVLSFCFCCHEFICIVLATPVGSMRIKYILSSEIASALHFFSLNPSLMICVTSCGGCSGLVEAVVGRN